MNGETVQDLGRKVDPERDHIAVDGRQIARNVRFLYILLHKPKGCVTTRKDPHVTNTVMDLILPALQERFGSHDPSVAGLHPVGRLDAQSEGLLILTNDGEFTLAMTHPRHQVPKRYVAEVRGIPDSEAVEKLRTGVPLFGQKTLPARVRITRTDRSKETARVEVEIREGRNQQVRRMLQAVGYPITRLSRVGIGPVTLQRLKPGQWRFLTTAEVETLRGMASHPGEESAEEPAFRPRRRRPPHPASKGNRRPAPAAPSSAPGRASSGRPVGSKPGARPPATGRGAGPAPARPAGPKGRQSGPPPPPRPAAPRPAGKKPTGPKPAGPRPTGPRSTDKRGGSKRP